MHVLRDQWVARSISQVDAAVLQEAVDREPFQQIEAIASRSQSPTSATKSAMTAFAAPQNLGRYRANNGHRGADPNNLPLTYVLDVWAVRRSKCDIRAQRHASPRPVST
jgi:hypothetical protein